MLKKPFSKMPEQGKLTSVKLERIGRFVIIVLNNISLYCKILFEKINN